MWTSTGQPEKVWGRCEPQRVWFGLSTQNCERKQQLLGALCSSKSFRGPRPQMKNELLADVASTATEAPCLQRWSFPSAVSLHWRTFTGQWWGTSKPLWWEGVEVLSAVFPLCRWVFLCLQAPAVWQ